MRTVAIKTGSFCDAGLERHGKAGRYERIEKAALELARNGLAQEHLIVVASADTAVAELLENLYRLVRLAALCGEGFKVRPAPYPKSASDPLVQACLARLAKADPISWLEEFECVLLDALLEAEKLALTRRLPARGAELRAAVERFHDYQDLRPL
mgnify:CR=1 FL=1